jgi:N-acetylmuramoyl-L-alanine amidase
MRWFNFLILFLSLPAWAGYGHVSDVRVWTSPDKTRVVFDLSQAVDHHIFSLPNPNRLVIDLNNTLLKQKLPAIAVGESFIQKIRHGVRKKHHLRVVLDLKQKGRVRSFFLKPNKKNYRHRLVVDIFSHKQAEKVTKKAKQPATQPLRDVVIAIDPGHGGEDPGASGQFKTKEKDVVLAIAKKLKKLIDRQYGMKAVLIRKGDYYIGLRRRMNLAREVQADLFVSIHADAFHNNSVRGSSVYVLSERGASSEAAHWLAQSENDSDMVGGVNLHRKGGMLAKVLMDLSQAASRETSREVAEKLVGSLKNVGKMHKSKVQHARFKVLKSPDIPSVLIETAFITNRSEEKNLKSPKHQLKIAKAIYSGIKHYYHAKPPHGTLLANKYKKQKHIVSRGETLGGIAQHYKVGLASLRKLNSIKGNRLIIGKKLIIPTGS